MEKLDHDIFGTQGLDDDDGVFEQDRENGEEGRMEGGAEDLGGGEDGKETVQGSQETEGGEEEEDEESESDDDIQIHIGPIETPVTPFYQGRLPSTSSMLANVSYTTHSSLVGGMRLSSLTFIQSSLTPTSLSLSLDTPLTGQKKVDVEAVPTIGGQNLYEIDLDSAEKPWRLPGNHFKYGPIMLG